MEKEAKARIRINRLLEHSGWRFFDDENGQANIALEVNVKIRKKQVDEFGDDFEKTDIWKGDCCYTVATINRRLFK